MDRDSRALKKRTGFIGRSLRNQVVAQSYAHESSDAQEDSAEDLQCPSRQYRGQEAFS
ncbi:MAG: hypothetical protein MUO26_15745 [Methanotrichaceae archaeon]|nr:hypothetical protein [Methanotrichaceae archaeon]